MRIVNSGTTILFGVAIVVAASAVVRARTLGGISRWILVPVAGCYLLLTLPTLAAQPEVAEVLASTGAAVVLPGLLLVWGVVYLSSGLASCARDRKDPEVPG